MKVNEYRLLEQAVDDGISLGWSRAHKHTEKPDGEEIRTAMFNAIMTEISEWFTFDGGTNDNSN